MALGGRADAQPGRLEPDDGGQVDLASQDPRVALERLKVADGYEVNLFASEREFPMLAEAAGDDVRRAGPPVGADVADLSARAAG